MPNYFTLKQLGKILNLNEIKLSPKFRVTLHSGSSRIIPGIIIIGPHFTLEKCSDLDDKL